MTPRSIAERDRKRFVVLRERALERYRRATLSDVVGLCVLPPGTGGDQDGEPSAHERYREVYRLVQERNRRIVRAFDGHSRSRAPLQFLAIVEPGLLTDEQPRGRRTMNDEMLDAPPRRYAAGGRCRSLPAGAANARLSFPTTDASR